MVGARARQHAHQEAEVVARGDEGTGQLVQDFGVAWVVLRPEIIDRVHQADPEEMRPKTVDGSLCEIGVVRGSNPGGELSPGIALISGHLTIEKPGGGGTLRAGDRHRADTGAAQAGEERGLAPELVPLP